MTLLSRNLNTVPVLHALLVEGSVAGAAKRVGLSQPTVSGILARLRTEFGDPLLVRSGRRMCLTARAERLLPAVTAVCADLERLYEPERFDAARLDREFAIAAPDHLAFLFIPGMIERLAEEAPGVRLRWVDVANDLTAYLDDGSLDLAVCADLGLWPGLRFRWLFSERFVAAMRPGHPLATLPAVTTDQIRRYPSSSMNSGELKGLRRPRTLSGMPSIDSPPKVLLCQFTDAVLLTIGTDFVAPAPEALVRRLGEQLPVIGVPLAEADVVQSGMFWSETREHDPAHRWFRSLVQQVAGTLA